MDSRVLKRFSDRIISELERSPVELSEEAHRAELKEALRRLMETDHYELLGVPPGATPEEVHDAFLQLARRVHPRHAPRLDLEQLTAALELLFERAVEAYLVLSDAERSKEYRELVDREIEIQPGQVSAPSGLERREEQAAVARRNFKLAIELARRAEYHFAVDLLHRSVLIDPQPEYYRLLADCQLENPKWLDKAIDNYRRAVEGEPDDADAHVALGLACERAGRLEEAMAAYRAAIDLLPAHQEALTGLSRVQQREREQRGGGSLSKVMDWIKG